MREFSANVVVLIAVEGPMGSLEESEPRYW